VERVGHPSSIPEKATPAGRLKLLLKGASTAWMWVRCSSLGIAPSWWRSDFQASWVALEPLFPVEMS